MMGISRLMVGGMLFLAAAVQAIPVSSGAAWAPAPFSPAEDRLINMAIQVNSVTSVYSHRAVEDLAEWHPEGVATEVAFSTGSTLIYRFNKTVSHRNRPLLGRIVRIPEPGTLVLIGSGLMLLGIVRYRRPPGSPGRVTSLAQ
ncbi:MAG: PEP-CTERM sorting domain-containing protein [Marinobacter sp.]|uniref:PEP-CTERM sorting domain-containing protein n=1 Tax=Marinobacter sp. TaxID=50741 RepID=UPI00299CF5FF|nr:PEP-CTERM sorting domain-containing protein [Marinobacter sp.]MDX1756119.1 PEP-CTERM sorting domain-containing protein [Marinobacter sp.]